MKFVRLRQLSKTILVILLILTQHDQVFSQSDSAYYWQKEISTCKSITNAKIIDEKLKGFIKRSNKASLLANANIILQAAAESEFSQMQFHDLFSFIENVSKSQNLETEFAIFAIRLESNIRFTSNIIQNQLYYYYTVLYFQLKDYYYADKYCNLFIKSGIDAFDNDFQTNYFLNAMTISALIDIEKNDLNAAYKKLNITLDSSISKQNRAWIGITKGNIGDIFYRQGNFDKAIAYLNEDIKASLTFNEYGSAMNSYIELNEIYTKQSKFKLANLYLDSAYSLLKQILIKSPAQENLFLTQSIDIYTYLANRFYTNKDFANASKFFAKAVELQKTKEENEKENQTKKIIQRDEINRNFNKINELREDLENKKVISFYFQFIIIAFIGVLIIYIVFYRRLQFVNKSLVEKNGIINKQNLELEKINSDKDKLFSIISHDLRGPSRNLELIFKAVGDNKLPFSSLENQMPNIIKNTSNLVTTLESLLNWSASQMKGIIVNKVLLDVNEAIEHNILFFEDHALKKNIRLINHCYSSIVSIDKNHLEIILRNFTSNAIKFSKQDGTIQFELKDEGDSVEVFVNDQGTGLTDDQVNNILNNTAMKSAVGTHGEKGIGLGLLLTKEFIEINGGSLKVKSELNIGTSMSFTIPKSN
jgi:signal transduction histidine kinase